ncbi:MAG TPA: IS110 family transposase [Dyella sp.]|nr:IS110 family transposase [Dyella sp.]
MAATVKIARLALDIGAKKHAWAAECGSKSESGSIDATPAEVSALIKRWMKGGPLQVLMEATGIYYLDAALVADELGATVRVINPRKAHHFAKAMGARNKTDTLDAAMLLECLKRMAPTPWTRPREAMLALRYYGRYLTQLTDDKVASSNRLHALSATRSSPASLRQDLKRSMGSIQKRIDRLRKEAVTLIREDEELSRMFDALDSIKGVGEVAAVSLLAELALLPRDMTSRACTAHAGLDPRVYESGTSVHKPPRISRQGNRHLRRALFHPALSAGTHDPGARALKERLQAQGRKPMQATVAIMRKLLTVAWAMVRNPQPYDSAKLFNLPGRA